jgi:hypothetical protein
MEKTNYRYTFSFSNESVSYTTWMFSIAFGLSKELLIRKKERKKKPMWWWIEERRCGPPHRLGKETRVGQK